MVTPLCFSKLEVFERDVTPSSVATRDTENWQGKESAGGRRPHLSLYLVPFLDFWIFTIRTSVQFM
jgi:hypothetical protein